MAIDYDRDNVSRASAAPADDAYMITPNDSANLATPVRAIRVAVAGDVRILSALGEDRTLTMLAGETLKCGALKVFSTGTTATGLLGYI